MYVQSLQSTRIGDRVYSLEATRESSFDGPILSFQVEVTADAGSFRASEIHDTILVRLVEPDREKAVAMLDALTQVARDAIEDHPFA